MVVPRILICPICGKRTYLRIEDGGYLSEYPIRVHCLNCRALMKGVYIMTQDSPYRGLHMYNAVVEECDVDSEKKIIKNADYVFEVSGELPCRLVREFDGHIITQTPYLEAADQIAYMQARIARLQYFEANITDWKSKKGVAFQLLDEGSIEYIATAIDNHMGEYWYECDNYLKSLHCLQEIVLEETKYLFFDETQITTLQHIIECLARLDSDNLHLFSVRMGGVPELLLAYRKAISVFSSFMDVYPNLLPAETYLLFKNRNVANSGISTCSFTDLKAFYQDSYEAILSLLYIPVCLDNILSRGDYQSFDSEFTKFFSEKRFRDLSDDFERYLLFDNGLKLNKIDIHEPLQGLIAIPADRKLRNGIGHNNIKYDAIKQIIQVYDQKDHEKVTLEKRLMDMATDCLGLVRSAVLLAEIILFILRRELKADNIHSALHPRLYTETTPNDKCPCGSNTKYKRCCKSDIETILFNFSHKPK